MNCAGGRRCAGLSIVDVLVSMAVVVLLMGLLLPSMGLVRETARRVICQSNVRQQGMSLAMYAQDYLNRLPPSVFTEDPVGIADGENFDQMNAVRLGADFLWMWDGLGVLYDHDYMSMPGVYYCPSHWGDHPFSRYSRAWILPQGEIISNYQFRGRGPNGGDTLDSMPAWTAIVADGMRTASDYNHKVGMNYLRADLTVVWVSDTAGRLAAMFPEGDGDAMAGSRVNQIWRLLDRTSPIGKAPFKDDY